MRELILKMAVSLDGYVCGPNREFDWVPRFATSRGMEWTANHLREAGALLLGRSAYCDMASNWPTSTSLAAPTMNELPKIVFSKNATFDPARLNLPADVAQTKSWAQARILTGDLAEEIRALKSEPGKPLMALGGATFAQHLVETGLVDEFRLGVFPIALGRGMPLFSRLGHELVLELVESVNLGGTVGLVYRRK
jgi:dihydrofolate reductase